MLVQLIGITAMILLIITYQINRRKTILVFQIIISICWILHYGLLGAMSGFTINVICFLRNILFSFRGKYRWASGNYLPVAVCALEVLSVLAVWSSPLDLLAIPGACLQTTALWMKDEKWIRRIMLAASPFWCIYDIFHHSYAGAMNEILVDGSLVLSMYRYDRNVRSDFTHSMK